MTTAYEVPISLTWTFGDRLRKIRLECTDLTQIGFAAVLGVSAASVGAWESGRSTPGKSLVNIARKIESTWGVPAAWTVGLTDDPPLVRHQGLEPRTRWLRTSHGLIPQKDRAQVTHSERQGRRAA